MPTYVLRLWLPDRPGALGAVASRIGAVRGDLLGIDILETGGGRAIDELAVHLPEERLVPLLVQEVGEVDGVDVEEVRSVDGPLPDPRLDALETAAVLVEQTNVADLLQVLTAEAQRDFMADWSAVVALEGGSAVPEINAVPESGAVPDSSVLASTGEPPEPVWLAAFLSGSSSSATATNGDAGPEDLAFALFPSGDVALVLGRDGKAFRARERRQLLALAKVAGARWTELTRSLEMPSGRVAAS